MSPTKTTIIRCDTALDRLVGEYVNVRRTKGEGVENEGVLVAAISTFNGEDERIAED